jgi:hypothetical protein
MRNIKGYIISLFDAELIPTGLKTALFVGTLLFLINHGAAFLRGDMSQERWVSVVLTYVMPYLVSVYGQYSYRRKISHHSKRSSEY